MTELKIPKATRIDTLSGDFIIVQPSKGQRYTTDDMLVAWLSIRQIKSTCIGHCCFLDLGSGLCSIPLIVLKLLPFMNGVGIEKDMPRLLLGKISIALNRVTQRFKIINGDVRNVFLKKTFSVVTSSPPYYKKEEGVLSPRGERAIVRFELNGRIADYFRSAEKHLEEGGSFITVYPFRYEKRILEAKKDTGLCIDRKVDVIPIEGKPPLISLYVFLKEKQGRNLKQTLMIRNRDRTFTEQYKEIRKEIGFPEPKG